MRRTVKIWVHLDLFKYAKKNWRRQVLGIKHSVRIMYFTNHVFYKRLQCNMSEEKNIYPNP